MSKWSVSLGLTVYIGYDDIEADSREEAEQIAKDRALEDINYNNCEIVENIINLFNINKRGIDNKNESRGIK